jgi:predicted DNA-binding protein
MVRTQVYLTEEQEYGLNRLAASTGRKQSELIREAVESYLAERRPKDWKEALEGMRGMWADRNDLDDLHAEAGKNWERRLKRLLASDGASPRRTARHAQRRPFPMLDDLLVRYP